LQNFDENNDSAIIPSVETLEESVPNSESQPENLENENNSLTEIIDYSFVPQYKVDKMVDKKSEVVRQNKNNVERDTQQQASFNYESILKFVKNGEF
jgi:hypothetical protein